MKELNNKGERFLIKWEDRRKHKWRYILINGCIYYGLSVAILSFLVHTGFKTENMQLSWFMKYAVIFMTSGFFVVLRQFNQTDRIYLSLTDESEIIIGIEELKVKRIWKYENLTISLESEDMITVQNDLFWFDEKKLSSDNINECYNLVYGDFLRLRKNADFDTFIRNKKIKIRIVDNLESSIPLFVKQIQDQ